MKSTVGCRRCASQALQVTCQVNYNQQVVGWLTALETSNIFAGNPAQPPITWVDTYMATLHVA
jgi:hypothetical protein